jgi:hypothetical protein
MASCCSFHFRIRGIYYNSLRYWLLTIMFVLQKAVLHDAFHWLSGFRVSKERIAFILKDTEVLEEPFKIKANRFFETSGNTFPLTKCHITITDSSTASLWKTQNWHSFCAHQSLDTDIVRQPRVAYLVPVTDSTHTLQMFADTDPQLIKHSLLRYTWRIWTSALVRFWWSGSQPDRYNFLVPVRGCVYPRRYGHV